MKIKTVFFILCTSTSSYFAVAQTASPEPVFSAIIGLGAGTMINNTYLDPKISKLNNAVIIERSDKMRYNATIGFSWTPFKYWVTKTDSNGDDIEPSILVSKGPTFAVFVNPLSLSNISETNKPFDWGVGAGWRFNAVSLLATIEFLNIRQPREYFLAQFEGQDKPLLINGNIQSEISTSDDTFFKSRGVAAIGIKLVIPIDLLTFGKKIEASKP